jgi:hypothetical protein
VQRPLERLQQELTTVTVSSVDTLPIPPVSSCVEDGDAAAPERPRDLGLRPSCAEWRRRGAKATEGPCAAAPPA